jgi:hypothetical protein
MEKLERVEALRFDGELEIVKLNNWELNPPLWRVVDLLLIEDWSSLKQDAQIEYNQIKELNIEQTTRNR